MKDVYLNIIILIERLHRLFLEVVKVELESMKVYDITNVQCFTLYNIGKNKLTVGEITNRGYYLGSNVTYNLKKMIENKYLVQKQSSHDKRSCYVQLSEKGLDLYDKFEDMLSKHIKSLPINGLEEKKVKNLSDYLKLLESFWSFIQSHNLRF